MIRLASLPSDYTEVHVIGSGPSAEGFDPAKIAPAALVIACNDAAHRLAGNVPHLIHITADYPYAKVRSVAWGALGVWVRLGDHPFPRGSGWPCWIPCSTGEDHWAHKWGGSLGGGVMVGGGAGCAAWNLADIALGGRGPVHLWGLDGGGDYERMRPGLEFASGRVGRSFTDHAGRLSP